MGIAYPLIGTRETGKNFSKEAYRMDPPLEAESVTDFRIPEKAEYVLVSALELPSSFGEEPSIEVAVFPASSRGRYLSSAYMFCHRGSFSHQDALASAGYTIGTPERAKEGLL